ncbi:MAG: GIY-YIG nuclease family protein [Synergistaceae bacterium]|nr:GIY-YIG nuclease family protein [Synergistota bacterium]NLM72289.1 GIY-YIG nuclease family protein [Synergistaceae bacterium]
MPGRREHTQGAPGRVERGAWVYILLCSDGTYYTGWTFDTEERLKAHNDGKGAKYTASRLPVVLVYREKVASMSEALRRELEIKRMNRPRKDRLVEGFKDESPHPAPGELNGAQY